MHSFTSIFSSVPGPRSETILALQMFARIYNPGTANSLENRWFDEHALTGETF